MTRRLPIFPLPDAVFFPETHLPLHVFEPRYREMLADALAGERLIGVQRLNPAAPAAEDGRPAVFEIGCAGEVVEHESLEDGRSNIVLRGAFRYRIESEPTSGRSYRIADVSPLEVRPLPGELTLPQGSGEPRRILVESIAKLAAAAGRPATGELPPELSDEGLVNEAASRLGLDADDRYTLLAMDALAERYAWVLDHVAGIQRRLDFLAPFRRPGVLDPARN